jgi:hypothetical protein
MLVDKFMMRPPSRIRRAPSRMPARDVMAVIKGIVDAAGEHGETEQHQLAARVERAVFGYLRPLDDVDLQKSDL